MRQAKKAENEMSKATSELQDMVAKMANEYVPSCLTRPKLTPPDPSPRHDGVMACKLASKPPHPHPHRA